ncbi:LamG domain-containing protein (plasmid) [Haladaptatus sp. SPP-AMP-3]|uniref:LamG domain-containing protein n=1 Tax=Haladaptatus sp. SPP-AMP-3 TaxID=3121295 RepID=UPI003C2BFEE4
MRRRAIVLFAIFGVYLVTSVVPVGAATTADLAVGSEHTTDSDFSNAETLQNVSVSGTGEAASVALDSIGGGVSRWSFDGDATDAWANNDGSVSGGSYSTGVDGQAISLSGADKVTVADSGSLDVSDITFSTWIKWDGTTPQLYDPVVADKYGSYQVAIDSKNGNSQLRWRVWVGGTKYDILSPNSVPADTWVHYMGTYDGSRMVLYRDGSQVGSNSSPSGAIDSSANGLTFGQDFNGDNGYSGSIDVSRIYSDAKSGAIAAQLHSNPGTDIALDYGTYVSANHSVSDAKEMFANLTLSNASATVRGEGWTGAQWQPVTSTSYSTSGNRTLDISGTSYETWRVNVSFVKTGGNPTAELHDEGILVGTQPSSIDNNSLSPNTTSSPVDSLPVTLSATVSDPDFVNGDAATVHWFIDGTERGTTTATSNGTTTFTVSDSLAGGNHFWHLEVTDQYGHRTTSATAQFVTPAKLRIFNETAPSTLVDSATVEVRMLTNETGAVEVFKRNTSDGVINMTGLPADKPFIVVAEADGYYNRRIFVPSLYETQSIYLLPETETVSDTIFSIDDYTGNYPSDDTVLLVQRPLNGNYKTVLGDYFGATGEFPAELAYNTRHRLVLYNVKTGEKRIVGTYTPLTSSTQTVIVTPKGVTTLEDEPPSVVLHPQVHRLPALDGTDISVTVREGDQTVTNWNVTASLQNDSSTTTVWIASDTSPGTLSKSLDLNGHHASTLVVNVTWTTSGGQSATKTYRISLSEAIGNDQSLLEGLAGLAALSPAGGARTAFTGFLAMLVTVLVVASVGSIQPSGEIAGLAGVLTLTGFSVIGFGVTYDLVFVTAVGFLSFAAIRRGL